VYDVIAGVHPIGKGLDSLRVYDPSLTFVSINARSVSKKVFKDEFDSPPKIKMDLSSSKDSMPDLININSCRFALIYSHWL